ncbi:MAG: SpoIIE family protein phosphatase [Deltaproteobacteria bacterium]|nr:SpoIIE family protein phosphatase [Deltaproteobacteria bacterium]
MGEFPGLPIGRLTLDSQLRIAEVDGVFAQVFGVGNELVGRAFDDLVSDRDPRGAVALAGALTRYRGGIVDLPLVIHAGGQDRVVRVRLLQIDGRFVAYVEPGDVEGTQTYELALTKQRWNGVLQRSDEGIVLLDQTGTIVLHNARFFELMSFRTAHGVSLTETALQRRELRKLLSPDFGRVADMIAQLASGVVEETVVRVDVDGRTLEFEGRTLRMLLRGNVETLVLVRDISEQQQIAARDALISTDLEQAARFQAALLARAQVPPGLELDITYRPLHRVGGDVYDVSLLLDGTTRLFIGDATGHGITAALSTMLIMNQWDAIKHSLGSPSAVLATLNDRVTHTYRKLSVMFTAAVVDISRDRRSIKYACGGHPSPLACMGGKVTELGEGGTVLGAAPDQDYPQWSFKTDDWTWLMMITDGISDARDANGDLFGEERIATVALEAMERGRGINASVMARVDSHLDMQAAGDDMTILTVRPVGRQ